MATTIFNYKDLRAKLVAMKDKIYGLKLEIEKMGSIKEISSKSSPNRNYNYELSIKNYFS